MNSDLLLGIVLTLLAYAGLMWAVLHGKRVVERLTRSDDRGDRPGTRRTRKAGDENPSGSRNGDE